MLGLAISAALAAEVEIDYRGVASVGGQITGDGVYIPPIEAELDLNLQTGKLYGRFDLDAHIDVTGDTTESGNPGLALPLGPEWAMLQYGDKAYVRAGITNPQIGFEDWDPWVNYVPTYSTWFNAASPGRNLGAEFGMVLESGHDVFVWGGWDLEWGAPFTGLGVAYAGDSYGTWSGIAIYPTEGTYATFDSFEFYPHDEVWITVDGCGGLLYNETFYGGQVFVQFMPERVVGITARGEFSHGSNGVFEQFGDQYADLAAGAGVRLEPNDYFRADLEGKAQRLDGEIGPLVHLQLTVGGP